MLNKYAYPMRVIRRNTSKFINFSNTSIIVGSGIKSKRSWRPVGKYWKKANSFDIFEVDDVSSAEKSQKLIANKYLLAGIDGGIFIPKLKPYDLFSDTDIELKINLFGRENPIEAVFAKDIASEALFQLEAGSDESANIPVELKAAFEAEVIKKIEEDSQSEVKISMLGVSLDTGLPKNVDLINSWKERVGKSLDDFIDGKEPGLIVGISGILLSGFKNHIINIESSIFRIAAEITLGQSRLEELGINLDEAGAKWTRKVDKKLELIIKQIDVNNNFYPLWGKIIKHKKLD